MSLSSNPSSTKTLVAGAVLLRISANVTGDFGNVTDLGFGAGLRG